MRWCGGTVLRVSWHGGTVLKARWGGEMQRRGAKGELGDACRKRGFRDVRARTHTHTHRHTDTHTHTHHAQSRTHTCGMRWKVRGSALGLTAHT